MPEDERKEDERKDARRPSAEDLTDAEEAAIQAAIARDPDAREASDAQLAAMRPAAQVLSPAMLASLKTYRKGRTRAEVTKVPVKLRLDAQTLAVFRASGTGWQTRMNEILGEAAKAMQEGTAMSEPSPAADPAAPDHRR